MKIGNHPLRRNELKLNKWYIGLEIHKCPPTMCNIFRPYIFIICVKFKQFAEPYDMLGNEEEIKIITLYLAAWFWQVIAMLFLVGGLVVYSFPKTTLNSIISVAMFLVFIGCEFVSFKRRNEIVE